MTYERGRRWEARQDLWERSWEDAEELYLSMDAEDFAEVSQEAAENGWHMDDDYDKVIEWLAQKLYDNAAEDTGPDDPEEWDRER